VPAKPAWFLRLPEILETVHALRTPVLDRTMFERLFEVRRRRAIQLMHCFGGYQTGRTFLIDRLHLITELERARISSDYGFEVRRKQRLAESLATLERHRTATRVTIPVKALPHPSLPADVRLEPGRLVLDFSSPEDLLSKLFLLAQKMADDFEGMCRTLRPSAIEDPGEAAPST